MLILAICAFGLSWPAEMTTFSDLPFAKEIAAFKAQDRRSPPELGQILFIGSSSFTRWSDLADYFPGRKVLNRAFGGSSLPDVIRSINDVVFPYKPSQIVIYCGENDFAGDPKLAAFVVYNRFVSLFSQIREKLPNTPIAYVSMKPSPSRWSMRAKFVAANHWISDFCSHQPKSSFVDVWEAMLDEHQRPKAEIFVSDRLHMNAKGYQIWKPLIEQALIPKRL